MKTTNVVRTAVTSPFTNGRGYRFQLYAAVFEEVVRQVGMAVQQTLSLLKSQLEIERHEDGYLKVANLFVPVTSQEAERALELITQDPAEKRRGAGKPARKPPTTARGKALPQYNNSYRMVEIVWRNGQQCVCCRLAESYFWKAEGGKLKGQIQRDVSMIDVTQGLQGLIKTWVKPPLTNVGTAMRSGICQQAGQQLNSYLGLLVYGKMPSVSFPSLWSRDPDVRLKDWHNATRALLTNFGPLETITARELDPAKFEVSDPKGDRDVTVDEQWLAFVRSPLPKPQTVNFVKSSDVVVYLYQPEGRLYASFPVFDNVPEDAFLAQLAKKKELWWWHRQVSQFKPLPAFSGKKLTAKQPVLLVPLACRYHAKGKRRQRLIDFFSGQAGRKVCWSLLSQKNGQDKPHWEAQFATSREVEERLRPNVLGIHFGLEPVLWWHLSNSQGLTLDSGKVQSNAILTEALAQALHLREEQGQQRWIGEKRFASDLKRRTDDVARFIVELASEHNANLALEKIYWVDKQRGGRDLNRRHSLWNYSQLASRAEWMGLEYMVGYEADPISTICWVSDYVLRYTCPSCGACRSAGQKPEKATTWLEKSVLSCRKCGFSGAVAEDHQAALVAKLGVERYQTLLAK